MGASPFADGTAALANRFLSDMPRLCSLRFPALTGLALLLGVAGAFVHPALGQERERGAESHDERGGREAHHERRSDRERGWRGRDYGYDVPSFGVPPPPLVYSPPPPPPGINFLFSFR